MKNVNLIFLVYAIAAVVGMIGIGVSLSFNNIFITLFFILITIIVMGAGFKTKKKLRELGRI